MRMYIVWIKIDEKLPWIELTGGYRTRRQAKKAAEEILNRAETKIIEIPNKKHRAQKLTTKH